MTRPMSVEPSTFTAAFTNASIVAKRVQITSFVIPATTILHGTVKSISASAWVITTDGKDTTVTIDAQTKILGDAKVGVTEKAKFWMP